MIKRPRSSRDTDVPRRRLTVDEPTPSALEGGSQFRRGQTLGNSRYVREENPSHRHRLHHLSHRRRHVGAIFLLISASVVFLALFLWQFTSRVDLYSTAPLTRPFAASEYADRIQDYYAEHPVERLRFMLNEASLTSFIGETHPEVSGALLSGVDGFTSTRFVLTFRQPVAGWQINNRQYFVDTDGVVFQQNYFDAPEVQIVDESGVSPEQGSAVASARLLSFVGTLVSGAGEKGYVVTSVTLPSGTTRQLDVRLKDVQPRVRVTIDRGAGEQVADMAKAVGYLQSRGVTAEYVDVRVESRAVYR